MRSISYLPSWDQVLNLRPPELVISSTTFLRTLAPDSILKPQLTNCRLFPRSPKTHLLFFQVVAIGSPPGYNPDVGGCRHPDLLARRLEEGGRCRSSCPRRSCAGGCGWCGCGGASPQGSRGDGTGCEPPPPQQQQQQRRGHQQQQQRQQHHQQQQLHEQQQQRE